MKRSKKRGLADVIAEAVGAKPGDTIQIRTPHFTRPPNEPGPASPPADKAAFDALKSLPDSALKEMGMRKWGQQFEHPSGDVKLETGPMLWLYPGEWYSSIPNGYEITDINFQQAKFIRGQTCNDIRFGLLAFGFTKE